MPYIRTHPDLTFPPRISGDSRQLRRWEKDLTFCQEEDGKKNVLCISGTVGAELNPDCCLLDGEKYSNNKKKLNTL